MRCPFCNSSDTKVVDSREFVNGNSIKRRRECLECKKRFTTYEKIEMTPTMVIKKDDTREVFDRDKVKRGIMKACEKRPVSVEDIERIVSKVEYEINRKYSGEVESNVIGEIVMDSLKDLDEVAYIRFASVYRQFKDINTFVNELKNILTEKGE